MESQKQECENLVQMIEQQEQEIKKLKQLFEILVKMDISLRSSQEMTLLDTAIKDMLQEIKTKNLLIESLMQEKEQLDRGQASV